MNVGIIGFGKIGSGNNLRGKPAGFYTMGEAALLCLYPDKDKAREVPVEPLP